MRQMGGFVRNKCVVIFLMAFGLAAIVTAYPTGKPDQSVTAEVNEEKRFPNGSVIGRYSYVDKDGNPIQVKYYADDSSYGVELKSLKIMETSTDTPLDISRENKKDIRQLSNLLSPRTDLSPGALTSMDDIPVGKSKINRYRTDRKGPDFEIYYQNELKGPEKCGKEKVHVYFDKERKIRNVLNNFETDNICEQF